MPKPEGNTLEVLAWNKCDGLVLSWLINSINPELHDSIAYHDSAVELWRDLEERFGHTNEPRVHELRRNIALTNQGSLTVASYYTKLKGYWDELGMHLVILKCTCKTSKEWAAEKEKERTHQFLIGLDQNFKTIRSQILAYRTSAVT